MARFGGDDPRIAAIISDWMMPGGDGMRLLAALRLGRFCNVPFVLISGAVTRERLDAAIKGGADGVLLKPFGLDALRRRVQEAIQRRAARGQRGAAPGA